MQCQYIYKISTFAKYFVKIFITLRKVRPLKMESAIPNAVMAQFNGIAENLKMENRILGRR